MTPHTLILMGEVVEVPAPIYGTGCYIRSYSIRCNVLDVPACKISDWIADHDVEGGN
jgi:hypothetical protein